MRDLKTIIVLSVVAIPLVTGIVVLAVINPYAALGLAPVLLAVAAIVRAIAGSDTNKARTTTRRQVGGPECAGRAVSRGCRHEWSNYCEAGDRRPWPGRTGPPAVRRGLASPDPRSAHPGRRGGRGAGTEDRTVAQLKPSSACPSDSSAGGPSRVSYSIDVDPPAQDAIAA